MNTYELKLQMQNARMALESCLAAVQPFSLRSRMRELIDELDAADKLEQLHKENEFLKTLLQDVAREKANPFAVGQKIENHLENSPYVVESVGLETDGKHFWHTAKARSVVVPKHTRVYSALSNV